jgi:hypothetical protein
MKKLLLSMMLAASSYYSHAQSGFAISVEASGDVGAVTGSIGQVAYTSHTSSSTIIQGVQQPYVLPQVGCLEPSYIEGMPYSAGDVVQQNDKLYQCKVAGWCSGAAWAYQPENGAYWEMAWTYLNDCGASSNNSATQRSASQNEEAAAAFMLYPNPANDLLYLTFNSALAADEVIITVTNQMGQLVHQAAYEVSAINEQYQIATEHLEAGAYHVAITSGNQTSTQKLVIVR